MVILLRLVTLVIVGMLAFAAYKFNSEWMAIVTFGGFIAGVIFMASYMVQIKEKLKAYKRELEKNSVTSDESCSQVKVLESKIEVLEKALENALNKNQ